MIVSRRKLSPFYSSLSISVPLTWLGVPGVHLGFRLLEPKPCDSCLSLWKRFVEGLNWLDCSELSAHVHTSASSADCLAITLKSKISQKSFKDPYWESFIALEQSACIWLMCVSFAQCLQTQERLPQGQASSMLSRDINALGLCSFKLLSSSETPARK